MSGVTGTAGWTRRLGALRGWRGLLLAAAAGASAAAALPPLHAVPVLLLAIPALLILLAAAATARRAAALGFAWGFGHHLAGVYWVTHALLTDVASWWWLVPIAAPALAVPLALFIVPPALFAWWLPAGWPRVLGFACAWTLAEAARGVLFTGFPWNLLGTVWAFHPLPLQGAALFGVHGLSLLTVGLAALPLLRGWRPPAAAALLTILLGGYGGVRLGAEPPPPPGPSIVLIQGNIEQELKWRGDRRRPIFDHYLDLTRHAAAAEAERHPGQVLIVLWPETASPYLLAQDPEAARLAGGSLPPDAVLLAGSVRAQWGPDGRAERVWNSLLALTPAGQVVAGYDKAHLVPFGEYMPLSGLLPIRLVAGGMDFSAGPGPMTLTIPGVPPLAVAICYEIIFPGAVVADPRPAWIATVTNDAWFGDSAGPWQHLAAARLRAVEEGLPVARAAQTGISALYDAFGRQVLLLPLGTQGTAGAALPGARAPTPFARFGSLLPLLAATAGVLISSRQALGKNYRPPAA